MLIRTEGHTISGNDITITAIKNVEHYNGHTNTTFESIYLIMDTYVIDADDMTERNNLLILEALKNA